MKRTGILIASLLIQTCLGGVYAWSTFVPALRADFQMQTAQTQLIFGLQIAVFTLSMVVAGKLLERLGPRFFLCCSAVLFFAGYYIASISGGDFVLLLVGISVVTGAAIGFGYVCPLSTCIKWFPEHKGLVTGIAVAGFGGGAMVLSSLAEYALENEMPVLDLFRWIGFVYGIIILLSGLTMSVPGGAERSNKNSTEGKSVGKDPFFWALCSGMFSGTFAGLLVIGNLTPIALSSGVTSVHAAMAVSAFAFGNAAGRISWGRWADSLKERAILPSLITLAVALALLIPGAMLHPLMFVAASFVVGFGFGACFVVYAVIVAFHYGAGGVGGIYPLVFLAYGAAGTLGPATGGRIYDATQHYSYALAVSVLVIIVGIAAVSFFQRKAVSTSV